MRITGEIFRASKKAVKLVVVIYPDITNCPCFQSLRTQLDKRASVELITARNASSLLCMCIDFGFDTTQLPDKCWPCVSVNHRYLVIFTLFFLFYALVMFRQKNYLVRGSKRLCFSLTNMAGNVPKVSLKISNGVTFTPMFRAVTTGYAVYLPVTQPQTPQPPKM